MLDGNTFAIIVFTGVFTLVLNSLYVSYTFGSWKGKMEMKLESISLDTKDTKERLSRIEEIMMKKEGK